MSLWNVKTKPVGLHLCLLKGRQGEEGSVRIEHGCEKGGGKIVGSVGYETTEFIHAAVKVLNQSAMVCKVEEACFQSSLHALHADVYGVGSPQCEWDFTNCWKPLYGISLLISVQCYS